MKIIHLSDLHLGKKLNELSLIEDQKYILHKILEIIKSEKPDAIILAGDIYDKTIPSIEAVQLLDDFLTQLALSKTPVFMISGNHDSSERLAFGSQLLKSNNIFISKNYNGTLQKITLTDEYGIVNFYLLPFIKPALVKHFYENENINNFNDALTVVFNNITIDKTVRNILVAHQFVTGAFRSDSEEIFVGGLDNVDSNLFKDFDYTALGHIHSPQNISNTIRYCGTPLKYSFSEWKQQKSVTIIELKEKGQLHLTTIPLTPLHDLTKIKGTYLELTELKFYEKMNRKNYFHITLTDEEPIIDAMKKLRIIYPNLLQLEYDNARTRSNFEIYGTQSTIKKSELEFFEEFYTLQNNTKMTDSAKIFINEIIDNLKNN